MNIKYTPGQLARWEAARREREALTRAAPIGFDPSKAEQAQDTVAATGRKPASDVPVASQGVNSGSIDLSGVTLDADGWSSWIAAPEGGWAVCPIPLARAMEWERKSLLGFSYINQPIAAADVWGPDCARIPAIRIKARPASDTEGLPVGVVVRMWYDGMRYPETPRYARFFGGQAFPWSRAHDTPRHAASDATRMDLQDQLAGLVYLPIDVRGA